jgi:hypothetical protein
MAERLTKEVVAKADVLFRRWTSEAIPSVITGREAANLSVSETGVVANGLRRHSTSDFKPVPLARVAVKVAQHLATK